jgi:hypothetical protein
MTDAAAITQILDRRRGLELADVVTKLLLDAPQRAAVARRVEECPLQGGEPLALCGVLAHTRSARRLRME